MLFAGQHRPQGEHLGEVAAKAQIDHGPNDERLLDLALCHLAVHALHGKLHRAVRIVPPEIDAAAEPVVGILAEFEVLGLTCEDIKAHSKGVTSMRRPR